jgi:hypothetical protein
MLGNTLYTEFIGAATAEFRSCAEPVLTCNLESLLIKKGVGEEEGWRTFGCNICLCRAKQFASDSRYVTSSA